MHIRKPLIGLILLAGALAWAAPARAQGTPVTDLSRETPVREYNGWLLFSRWDGSAYRLSTWHQGKTRDLPVPRSSRPFDADVGPDSDGHPSAVVSLCRDSCDLFVIGFAPGDRLRPVRNANTGDHDEFAPSVWKGRLVFARRYGRDHIVPYTKRLEAPRSRPSSRLADLPDRRCGAVSHPDCRRIKRIRLKGMELWGRWVAQSWTYQPHGFPGHRQNEIRLTDVDRTDTRQLAYMTSGEGGQTYLGPSIAEGRVAFFRACHADTSGCSTHDSGAVRYRISNRRYELDAASKAWTGWAWSGTSGYHVPSEFDCRGGDPSGPPGERCAIYRRDGLDWTSVSEHALR
jgi:hypothetical protein